MATSGYFNTNAYGSRYVRFEWNQVSQSIADNTTTIHWELKGAGGDPKNWYMAGNFQLYIHGELLYSHKDSIKLYNQTLASGDTIIPHNPDGTKHFSASFLCGIYYAESENTHGSGSWALETIPRKAVLTSAPDFNDEQNPTISYNNPVGNAVDSLQACISWTGAPDIAYRDIPKTGNSYTFNLTEAERAKIRNYCSDANSKTVSFYIWTKIGSALDATESVERTVSIINANPTIQYSAYDTNKVTQELTGDVHSLVYGESNISLSSAPTAYKGASIAETSIFYNGSWHNEITNATIQNATDPYFEYWAKDSRGNVCSNSLEMRLVDYRKPTVYVSAKTGLENGGSAYIDLSVSGTYFNGSFGIKSNAKVVEYRWGATTEPWSKWYYFDTTNDSQYSGTRRFSGLDYTKTYEFEVRITDELHTVVTNRYKVNISPLFDWGKNDFQFHVKVDMNNNGIENVKDPISESDVTNKKYVDGKTGTDTIVAEGSSGIWQYRKWASGRADLIGSKRFDGVRFHVWGSGGESDQVSFGAYPFTLYGSQVSQITADAGSSLGISGVEPAKSATPTTAMSLYFLRPDVPGGVYNIWGAISVYARWKQ